MKIARLLILALAASLCINSEAASKVRLIYGKDWSEASRRVKAKLEKLEKAVPFGKYTFEYVDEESAKAEGNLGTLKIPAIFAISEDGDCFCVIENKVDGRALSTFGEDEIFDIIVKAEDAANAARKNGFGDADRCGEFLKAMEPFVGGSKRVVSKGFYEDVFAKLKSFDPADSTGWQRRFTMGNGIDIVTKATEFKTKKDFAGGQAYLDAEFAKPTKHLSTEQMQSLYMAKFALYREDPSRRDEMKKLLLDVAKLGEETLWGTSAVGWLNILGAPPLSVYWGWRKGDFKGSAFSSIIQYGVDCSFPTPGEYTIAFEKMGGNGPVEFRELALWALCGEEQKIIKAKIREASQGRAVFSLSVDSALAGHIKMMELKGVADDTGDTLGTIKIKKTILRERGKAK